MSRKMIVLATISLALVLSAAITLRSRSQEPARASGPDITQAVSDELIARAELVPKTRRPSRPTLASKVRRLTAKSQRSSSKKLRGRISDEPCG